MRLFENFDDALAAFDLRLRRRVEVGPELRERRQLAELREVQFDPAGDLFHRLDLRRRTDARHRQADRNRRAHTLIKQVCFQINLAVGDGDHVRRNVSGDVAELRFDDGQRRQGTIAIFLVQPGGAFEQTAVQIKHVAGIGFAAGRPLQHERHLTIRHGVLGQIVVNDQRVHGIVHEPFAHGAAGEGREILVGRGVGRGSYHDDGVRHGIGLFEHVDDARDVRLFLAHRDINAVERAILAVAGGLGRFVQPRIADDRVDADGRLAGGTVADDQFALAAADGDHRVDGHNARLHRLADRLAPDDAGRDFLYRITRVAFDGPFAVHRLAERVDGAS